MGSLPSTSSPIGWSSHGGRLAGTMASASIRRCLGLERGLWAERQLLWQLPGSQVYGPATRRCA